MKNTEILRSNFKFLSVMFIVIIFGMVGITYAVRFGDSKAVNLSIDTSSMDVNISYDSASNGANISSIGDMFPISDDLITGTNINDSRVIKVKFAVSNTTTNSNNSIYDVVLRDIDMDCELKTEYLKWRLYKNDNLLSEGSFSPTFDTMEGNRLVLTETQQDLTTSSDTYVFLMWISESCPKSVSIEQCTIDLDQSRYLNQHFSANIKLELATLNKKELVRNVGSQNSCNYAEINVPKCNTLTYNGSEQQLINKGNGYILSNSSGVSAGKYVVTAKLIDGYKWVDGTTSDKLLSCDIGKKTMTITSLNQEITYGEEISNTMNNINVSELLSGDTLNSFKLTSSIVDVGSGVINISNIKILDSSSRDVTSNYDVNINEGKITINCINLAEEPSVSDKSYNGSEQIGVTDGKYITISGSLSGTSVDTYTAYAEPIKNYCWYDGQTNKKVYNWQIANIQKTDPTLSVSASSLNVSTSSSNDLTYTYDGDGDISCDSSNTSVATCTVDLSTKKLTIKSLVAGSATITLNASASELFTSTSEKISISVTGTLSGGSVKITGINTYGETLTADVTNTNPISSYQYQWYYNTTNSTSGGTAISGANGSTYKIGSGLIGKYIYVVVTASKESYNSKVFSDITDDTNNTTATVSKANPELNLDPYDFQEYYPNSAIGKIINLGEGILTCSTSNSSIATCSIENDEITITPISVGTVNITINISEDTEYSASTIISRANFAYKTYTVKLNNQNATSSGTTTLYGQFYNGIFLNSSYTNKMSISANKITVPSKTGYIFGGYYTGTLGSGTQILSQTGFLTSNFTNTMYSYDITLYAKWTIETYDVIYDANGGRGEPDSQIKTYGRTLTLSSTIPVKDGYIFKGWSTSSTATTATYNAGDAYTSNADTTLYAVWGTKANVEIYVDNYKETSGVVEAGATFNATDIYVPWDNPSISCDNGSGSINGSSGDYTVTVNNIIADTVCNIT